ncbi:MAG: lipoate--protein ligase family protein [Spirochaetaceae bacterium]|jgi:lipoate-protein ligase A|nr:lipoate--protein ligase family protein [Spirochaetaceae bacterium]
MDDPVLHPMRLLKMGRRDAFYNMGLDEALLEAVSRGASPPVLRLYGWSPPAVSVGYFQGLTEEIDLEACKRHGVDVVRRISGGGAVFHQAEVTYSIVMPLTHPLAGNTIQESYETLCRGVIRGLDLLGVSSRFIPVNDIISGERKISGNAQTRRLGCLLQHGTVLLENEVDLMFELLRVPSEKLKGKIIRDVKDRITSLKLLLGRPVSFPEAEDALAEGFRQALSLEFIPDFPQGDIGGMAPFRPLGSDPTPPIPRGEGGAALPAGEEEQRARELAAEKFSSPEWIFKR